MRRNAVFWIGFVCVWVAGFHPYGQRFGFASTPRGGANPCDTAAERAATSTGVPLDLLRAIARVETGRSIAGQFEPWPWTVNQAGSGSFFDTATEAVSHASQAMAKGESNIDIGCFQVNIRWHGKEFPSLEAMFDPNGNAVYAARFLVGLHKEFGSWEGAVGAYHSRNSGAATVYLSKVAAIMERSAAPAVLVQTAKRDNRYPLLQPGRSGRNGSLLATTLDRPAVPFIR
ncbi:MAG: hypothetical protein ACK4VZ_07960 [Paracoccaceae bacterium]